MRHPIERLLSAYRDRIAGLKFSFTFYQKVAATLGLKRKDAWLPAAKKGKKRRSARKKVAVPTWPEFVSYILQTRPDSDVSSVCLKSESDPSLSRTCTGASTPLTARPAWPTSPTSSTWRTTRRPSWSST